MATCPECGSSLDGVTACIDHFHALLAAETENAELGSMHGLSVLTYYAQHPSQTKPWLQVSYRATLYRVFALGERWESVLLESHPRGVGRRASAARTAEAKAAGPGTMPDWVVRSPGPGELTVTSIDLTAPAGQRGQVEAWARSVAEHRYLPLGAPQPQS